MAFRRNKTSDRAAGRSSQDKTSQSVDYTRYNTFTSRDAYVSGGTRVGSSAYALSRSNAAQTYAKRRAHNRLRTVVRTIFMAFLILLTTCGAAVGLFALNLNSRLTGSVDSTTRAVLSDTIDDEPFYALLLGIDENEERDASGDSVYRSDTIILCRIDPGEQLVTLVSIPRDTVVEIEGYGEDKINAAYAYGGASLAITTVEDFAGVDISHYAEIDMDGFAAVVDQVGGVTVNLPVAVYDPDYTGLDLPAGEQTLDGTTASLLARSRHAYDDYGGGDYYRAANQRMLIGAVVQKLLASDLTTITSTISTMADYVTTDMSVADLASLAANFLNFDASESMYSGQCPVSSEYVDDVWQDIVDEDAWAEMMERVDSGLPPYEDSSDDFTAGIAASLGITSVDELGTDELDYSGSVVVLNATETQGLATEVANELSTLGFSTSAGNTSFTNSTTVIYYNGSSGASKAAAVAEALGGSYTYTENDGTYDTRVDVIVVLGSDYDS